MRWVVPSAAPVYLGGVGLVGHCNRAQGSFQAGALLSGNLFVEGWVGLSAVSLVSLSSGAVKSDSERVRSAMDRRGSLGDGARGGLCRRDSFRLPGGGVGCQDERL